jgi:hypothetical protein
VSCRQGTRTPPHSESAASHDHDDDDSRGGRLKRLSPSRASDSLAEPGSTQPESHSGSGSNSDDIECQSDSDATLARSTVTQNKHLDDTSGNIGKH